ncbi:AraC family transcriptional regulator [Photobacterium sp. 2_MG-2023]|uniref:AraC family transcriptional regulator n=1 Tax=Photobacterium arenosum TaxID=2774143 RepID=A0ABR9BHX6_9GAMM|nr:MULTISPECIES: AraC family transcriptional regulator [Photobacterium]MBD8512170.1 AraC family transcriptional regulator [Photobacterium arenosum]MDO6581242.1 AraC family transcriptional regulator [Photobacterium sp. 2_MG-2023]
MKPDNSFQFITSPHLAGVTLLHATMSDFSYDKHAHEEYAIGVTLKGRQDFFCQRAFHRSPPGGVLIFNPEDVHDGCSGDTQELEYRMLYIHPEVFIPQFRALGVRQGQLPRISGTLLDDMILRQQTLKLSALMENPATTNIELESGLFQLSHSLVRRGGQLNEQPPTNRIDTLLLRAKEYIHAHLNQNISIDDIASAATMSKYHFIRLFRSQFGITPHQYVINCRINNARKALETGESVIDVATDCGFSDISHLNRRFKRSYGMTPKQYQLQITR